MNFISAFLAISSALLVPTVALTAGSMGKEQFHYSRPGMFVGPTMWIFGSTGLKIYNPDGSEELVSTPPEDICHNVTGYRGGAPQLSCSFYDVISDGKKYIWGAVSRGVAKIDVFDIDTGNVVGSFETCNTPRDLEYHPLRDEIWVRCMGTTDEFSGYMDVFSAASPTGNTIATVDLTGNHTLSAYGYSIIDNSLGDVGYASVWNQNKIYKIGLSERKVLENFTMPNAYGAYEVAFSRMNQHIFVRASVCCTCGYVGSDKGEDCGRYGSDNVTITTGPLAGQVAEGQCGRCDGLTVDNIGVYEFDTNTDTIVGQHTMADGTGGDPFASPDGRFIVLVGFNGGEVLRVLKMGAPDEKSSVAFDLELGFDKTDAEKSNVFNDFAFIQTDGSEDGIKRDMIIVGSGTENKIAIVDMLKLDASGHPELTIVTLSASEESSSNRNRRQVEWVVGTPFVWIDGTASEEVYVANIDEKTAVRTITGVKTSKMLSVENYERKRIASLISDQIMMQQSAAIAVSDKETTTSTTTSVESSSVGSAMAAAVTTDTDSESKTDAVGIAALIVGLVAIVVGAANMVSMNNIAKNKPKDNDGTESLGSKNIA